MFVNRRAPSTLRIDTPSIWVIVSPPIRIPAAGLPASTLVTIGLERKMNILPFASGSVLNVQSHRRFSIPRYPRLDVQIVGLTDATPCAATRPPPGTRAEITTAA